MTQEEKDILIGQMQGNLVIMHLLRGMFPPRLAQTQTSVQAAIDLHNLAIEELSKAEVDEDTINWLMDEMERVKERIDRTTNP